MQLEEAIRIAVDILSSNDDSKDICTAKRLEAAQVLENVRKHSNAMEVAAMNCQRTNWYPKPYNTK